jgi:large subunit ribosomal protein L6
MSVSSNINRFAKHPLPYDASIQVAYDPVQRLITGVLGAVSFSFRHHSAVTLAHDAAGHTVQVQANHPDPRMVKMHSGTVARLLLNAFQGLVKPYEQALVLVGVGYKILQKGPDFEFHLGKSHVDLYKPPSDVTVKLVSPTEILLSSHDRCALGMAVEKVIVLRPVEPYKGKGIRRKGQVVVLKKREKST